MVKAAREGAVRTLAKLHSDERKGWREVCARENEKLFRVHQELTNLKVANAALMNEKAAAEAVAKEAKEAEAHGAKALEEADADRNNLNKAAEGLKVEVQNGVTIIEEVTASATEAEAPAREAAEARDSLVSSLDQLKAARDWMCDHGIEHIVGTILDAPKNASVVNELMERAREEGFKAAVNAYNSLSISAIEDIDKCLEAEDYVDRLRLLYDDPEEEETTGGAKGGAGTNGTKED
ncbi:uncharacterized protein LOC110933477 [Helianthus annuus]|uniref:uncharacterized protein LOC110933477 n=1 Tax=Helianthus annuus TaxID=4232 RepID=UPI000B9023C9|nr:uncharacterized protein LOC110933477 [Helianthus annuus]